MFPLHRLSNTITSRRITAPESPHFR